MIGRGYRLPFAQYPSQCFLKNDRSALQHPEFVAEAITKLLNNGCIVEHVVPPFCMNPLTVAEGKKLRLLIDLRRVNSCLALAMDIFNLCLVNSIILEAQWIPRSLNERADFLSRFVDKDDWSVNPSVFRVIDAKWGPHTIDRFASHYNAQVPRFNSKFSSPGCSGVDALA
ncbi:unnamed protein product [Pocillopora meandrina]|uniref:Uncharacterized protein n=1 Tax=Pocillopora meandrina TaxID=46732 RepID=A0AAU9XVQ5_9CNID|nr:unnamed protein product [Pocillopora meandrina]